MSGVGMLVRTESGRLSIREYAVTGAPRRSTPKNGKLCGYIPSRKAACASSSEAITLPWPPRPGNRTSSTHPPQRFPQPPQDSTSPPESIYCPYRGLLHNGVRTFGEAVGMCLTVPARVLERRGARAFVTSRGWAREVDTSQGSGKPGDYGLVRGGGAVGNPRA